jgi:hypothetical protein
MAKMLADVGGADPEKETAPEIAIIKDILLSDLKRAHEARLESLEERLAALSRDVDGKLTALAARIEAVGADSGQSQKRALTEIGHAITQIALGLRPGASSLGRAEEALPHGEETLKHAEEASSRSEEAAKHADETAPLGDEAPRHSEGAAGNVSS